MTDVIHSYTLERDGMTFRVDHCHDSDALPPWADDGHGAVEEATYRDKRPGELLLSGNPKSGMRTYYDFTEACRIAMRDGWGTPDAQPGMSKRQVAALAARADYEFLRAWCRDEWSYIGVVVTLVDIEGNETDATDSLWRVDDNGSYPTTVASDCVDNVMHGISAMLYGDDGAVYMSGSRSWRVKE